MMAPFRAPERSSDARGLTTCAAQSASSPCARDGPTDGGETFWTASAG